MIRYCLGPWQSQKFGNVTGWAPPPGTMGLLDFRSIPDHANAGVAFFAIDDGVAPVSGDYQVLASSNSPNGSLALTSKQKTDWQSALKLGPIPGSITTLADFLALLLTEAADHTGDTFAKPILPSSRFEIRLGGHGRIWSLPLAKGDVSGAVAQKAIAVQKLDLAALPDGDTKDKCLAILLRGYGFAETRQKAFEIFGIDREPKKPTTTLTDAFTRANGAIGTSSEGWSWTSVQDTCTIDTNRVGHTTNGAWHSARAESALSSADHEAQLDTVAASVDDFGWGPAVRFAAAATTFYGAAPHVSADAVGVHKWVAGVFTSLADPVFVDSLPDTFKLSIAGSTLIAYANGVDISAGGYTDSAISGNVRTGIIGFSNTTTILGDNFSAADNIAAGGSRYTVLI